MQGFLNLNKPFGITSHDCVAKVRRLLRQKKVGHGGTLDPAATGVLPIALGKATRLLQYLREDKAYRATIKLGITTTTDDLQGEVIAEKSANNLTLEAVKIALEKFQGIIQQIPPNYSAIQVQGKRLYDLARAGENIIVAPRPVEIHQIDILDWRGGEFPELDLEIACGPGTYIRAIARDLGIVLQTGGTLAALTRTASCGLQLTKSLTFADLETQLEQGTFNPISPETVLEHLAIINLSAKEAKAWCQGQRIPLSDISTEHLGNVQQIYHEDDRFLGIGKVVNSEGNVLLLPQMVFALE
ncbi:tRNA pseudouridine(55) synthase TruB [Phormidium sp. LEGE 05292]|uniref:tRNA pseudouridine(55) synthase TruB n=1 Tax=[Phormidium] sp. LEGE 05292 TaxID=767427 RepID=UPI00187F50F9|nr:tRNA pseudouridine(55) synthase TruB [Phormidium sp. LEGE 05292]MBE9223974.1 tRNA pseudouridine(55) synthase TruB [Phormidium sp. LEGE 05292]